MVDECFKTVCSYLTLFGLGRHISCFFCWDQRHNSFTFTRIYIHTHAFQKIHFLMGLWKPSRIMFQNLSLGNLVCYLTCVVFYTDFKWTADVDHNLQMIIFHFYFTDIRNRLDMFPCKIRRKISIIEWLKRDGHILG